MDRLCFVIMPFSRELHYFYLYLQRHIELTHNFRCERADDRVLTIAVLDKVLDYVRRSDVIIADCSGRNPNVFYELGIAHAMEKKVILITSDPIVESPSDIRHLEFIKYDLGDHTSFLERLDNAMTNILRVAYESLHIRSREVLEQFSRSTGSQVEPASEREFIRRVVEAEATGTLPELQDEFAVTQFVLPKIIANSLNVDIMSQITAYVTEVGERRDSAEDH